MKLRRKCTWVWLTVLVVACGTATGELSPPAGQQFRQARLEYVGELAPGYSEQEVARHLRARVVRVVNVGPRRFALLQGEGKGKPLLSKLAAEVSTRGVDGVAQVSLPEGLLNLEENYELSLPEGPAKSWAPGMFAHSASKTSSAGDPDDTLYAEQYAPQATDLPRAWKLSQGEGMRVAVIDSGINTRHEDFQGTSFEQGWDYIFNSTYPTSANYDWNGHGTHVAGIIAAGLGNGRGISGVAPKVTLIPYRVLDASGSGDIASAAEAIAAAARRKVDVINLSLGSSSYSTVLAAAVQQAVSAGILVVAAAGNDGIVKPNYPAALPGVVAVASSDRDDHISYYSSRGDYVNIAAPGEDILSLDAADNHGYVVLSGTSMAAPFVSGVFALLKQHFPGAQAGQLIDLLDQSAAPAGAEGYDTSFGWGLVRPYGALQGTLPAVRPRSRWTIVLSNKGRTLSSPAAINVYSSERTRLFSLYSDKGHAAVDLPYGDYYYSVSYYGHGSGLRNLELRQPQHETRYGFDLDIITISTLEPEWGSSLDTVLEAYAHSIDPYNMVGVNDDRELSFYSTLTVARAAGESLLLRVLSYDGSGGDYLLYLNSGDKSLAHDFPRSSEIQRLQPSAQPTVLQSGVYYQDSLTSAEPWHNFLLP